MDLINNIRKKFGAYISLITLFDIAIFLVIIFRIAVILLLVNGYIYTRSIQHEGWIFWLKGDDRLYFDLANSLINFQPVMSKFTLGFPIFLIPFILITNASDRGDIHNPFVIFNSIGLYSLAIILVGQIAKKLTENKYVSLIAALLFAFFPFKFITVTRIPGWGYRYKYVFLSLSGLSIGNTVPSMFFSILGIYFFLYADYKQTNNHLKYIYLSGISLGFTMLLRMNNLLLLIPLFLFSLFKKKFKDFLIIVGICLIIFIPQFVYNSYFFGNPLMSGYIYYEINGLHAPRRGNAPYFSSEFFVPYLLRTYNSCPIVFILTFVGVPILTFLLKKRLETMFLLSWFFSYLIFFLFDYYSIFHMWRFLFPAIPVLCIFMGNLVILLKIPKRLNEILRAKGL